MVAVDVADDLGVAASAQDWRRAGVRVDAGEVGGRKRKDSVAIIEIGFAAQEEAALCVREPPTLSPRDQRTELKLRVDIGEPLRGTRSCV